MDVVMPGEMDGIEACGRIQNELDIPVVLLTAYADDAYIGRAKGVEPGAYLLKPCKNDQIRAAVEVALENRRRARIITQMADGYRNLARHRETQIKEIHHRAKNNFVMASNLLNLQSMYVRQGDCRRALRDSGSRISTLAALHERLYRSDNPEGLDAAEYVESVVRALYGAYAPAENISLTTDLEPMELSPEILGPVGLIVTELVTNALKYAFTPGYPGQIMVRFRRAGEAFELLVSDNGVGFPKDFELSASESMGLGLVWDLVYEMGGSVDLESTEGAIFTVRLPVPLLQ
jgi:two-component sensor histidine kinase